MESSLQISSMLNLGLVHITEGDHELLKERACGEGGCGYLVQADPMTGVMMVMVDESSYDEVQLDCNEPLSASFRKLVRLAKSHGCHWLRFSPSGPIYKGIKRFPR